jgi:hypothetical protein
VPCTFERCNTPGDLLHRVVSAGLPELIAAVHDQGRTLPGFVVTELERFVACGDPAHGFAWLHCADCDHHRLVPFSCKGRGICPSCGGRRMCERAARWVDGLLPRTAVRQWVVTFPWPRRWLLARKPELLKGVAGRVVAEISRWVRRLARRRGHQDAQCGAVVVVQRFGSGLELNLHFHILMPDGYFATDNKTGIVRFFRDAGPSTADVEAIVVRIADRAERWLEQRGFGCDDDAPDDTGDDDALPLMQAASIQGRLALGPRAGRKAHTTQVVGGRRWVLPARCATVDGYCVHAGVVVGARSRAALERLCRYVCRPPLAKDRLEELPDGSLRLRLKTPWRDGTSELHLSRLELLQRIAAIIPPPKANQVLYYGCLAPRSKLRPAVVPKPLARRRRSRAADKLVAPESASEQSRWMPWAWLLRHVFDVDSWTCPCCGKRLVLRAVVKGPPASVRILRGLAASSRGPPEVAAG